MEPSDGAAQAEEKQRLHEKHLVKNLQVGVALVGVIIAACSLLITYSNSSRGDVPSVVSDGSAVPGAPSPAQSTAPTAVPPRASAETAVGKCLDAASVVVDCSRMHAVEVVGAPGSDCDASSLVLYLGGDPAVDVTIASPVRLAGNGLAQFCAVELPVGADPARSAKELFRREKADQWRRCTRDSTGRESIACSSPHVGEYIGLAPMSSDCATAFFDYTGRTFEQVSDLLQLRRVQLAEPAATTRCLAAVLGDNHLNGTLRDLRAGALPLA